jgi:hypothetical protein
MEGASHMLFSPGELIIYDWQRWMCKCFYDTLQVT